MSRQIKIILLLIIILLVGCSPSPKPPSATPAIPSVTEPSLIEAATETPTSPAVTQTSLSPEPTPSPEATMWSPPSEPQLDPDTLPGASAPYVSSLGQMAFIHDGVLVIETSPSSGVFQEIDRYVTSLRWSPDGMKLLYDVSPAPVLLSTETTEEFDEYRVWFAERTSVVSLSSLIPGFPQPPYLNEGWVPHFSRGPAPFRSDWIFYDWQAGTTAWSPDSTKILFVNIVEPDSLSTSFPGANTIAIADLQSGDFRLVAEANLISAVYPVDHSTFLLQDHCGTDCEWLSGYNHLGELVWQLPWVTGGFYDISSDNSFLVNAGRIAFYDPTDTNTVDEVNLLTGEFKEIWRLSSDQTFPTPSLAYPTKLSPDDHYVSFNILVNDQTQLQVIDRQGNGYLQIPNTLLLEWDPAGGVIGLQPGSDASPGSVQLELWHLPSGKQETILGPINESFYEAEWSPDAHYLALCSYDDANQQQNVRMWDRQANQVIDVQSALSPDASLCNFAWIPDSNLLYFRLTRVEPTGMLSRLYAYDVRSGIPQEVNVPTSQP